jgi:hypothetical protein
MGNEVYANTREISCKAAAGKSTAAFPDTCFTPPQTPATPPGVPIPYPNTGMSSDTDQGSKTVQISGQEVMLKDSSCFKKSTGDEAGSAPKKGVITSKITGKVYFSAWSMDVKVEGENVVRHLDIMTHNHASLPANTPTWPYFDNQHPMPASCAGNAQAVKDNCPNAENEGKTHHDCPQFYASKTKNAGYKNDDCVKAKRCMLVPYDRGKSQGGCCEPQTGHHLVPKHHFSDKAKYNQGDAPCVCAEGHSWHRNDESLFPDYAKTHPDVHDIQDAAERSAIDDVEAAEAAGEDLDGLSTGRAFDYATARDTAIDAHSQVFKDSKCDPDCMKAQLDNYHNQAGVKNDDLVITKRVGASEA